MLFFKTVSLFITVFILFVANSQAALKTWDGDGVNDRWTNANNWDNNTAPAAGDDIYIPAGFNNVVISRVPNISVNSLRVASTNVSFTANGTATTLTINNIDATNALNITGSVTMGDGTAGNAVNLSLSNINTATIISGTLTISTNTSLTLAANQTLTLGGTLTNNGTVTFNNTGSTVNYSRAGAQSIVTANYYNLTISGNKGGGNITFPNGGTVGIANNYTLSATNVNYVVTGNTINFNGTAQNIPSFTFNNLTISGGNTKTLQGNVTVNATLNLNNGNINLTNYDLTVGVSGSITGTFNNTHMIVASGTGSLNRQGDANADFNMTYPVGTGTYYTPLVISNFTGTITNPGSIKVRPVASQRVILTNALAKYWNISTTNLAGVSADLSFSYNAAEVVGSSTNYSTRRYDNTNGGFAVTGTPGTLGNNPFTTTGATTLDGDWTAVDMPVLYSYQSGDWKNVKTWTTDPSGTLWISAAVPGPGDNVVILNGRKITVYENSKQVASLEIKLGGILNLQTYTGHNFGTVSGQGNLQIASATFPGGTYTSFVSSSGGTVEYINSGADFQLPASQTTYNNLTFNLDQSTRIAHTMNSLTINGNLNIVKGNFRISDNGAANADNRLIIDIKNDVTVSSSGQISVGTRSTNVAYLSTNLGFGNTAPYTTGNNIPSDGYDGAALVSRYYDIYHKVYIGGSLTNNGTVKFISSAIAVPNFITLTQSGAATVRFYGSSNEVLTCNGTTDFYNLIIDKGSDKTYELQVDASSNTNFRLFGRNDWGGGGPTCDPNPELKKALWLKNGTLRLTGYTTIPTLSEGNCGGGTPNSDFYVPVNGAFIIDGPNVTVLTSADDYREINAAWGFAEANNNNYNVGTYGCSSFSILGKLQINDGYFSGRETGGFIFWPFANGEVIVNGGTLDAKQFRSATAADCGPCGANGYASLVQTGGYLQLRGRYVNNVTGVTNVTDLRNVPVNYSSNNANSTDGSRGTFNLASASTLFSMSAGTVEILDACSDNGYVWQVLSSSQSYNVTGGSVILNLRRAQYFKVYSTSNFYDLTVTQAAAGNNLELFYETQVSHDLSVTNGVRLTNYCCGTPANSYNLSVAGNFTLDATSTYDPGQSTFTFNGSGGQVFTNTGAITNGLYKLKLSNGSNLQITQNLTVLDSLTIGSGCYLNDMGQTISISGNIINNGTHYSQANGNITLASNSAAQYLSGSGTGIWGNLNVNKTSFNAILSSNQIVNGNIRLINGLLDINKYELILGANASIYDAATGSSVASFSATKMITTNGLQSDGGINKYFTDTRRFTYPLGTGSKFTPAYIQINQTHDSGYISIRPVNQRMPFATGTNNALNYYWKTSSEGFASIPANNVNHVYKYVNSDVAGPNENTYVPGVYNPTSWSYLDQSFVDETRDSIKFTNQSIIDGSYTAGETGAFGTVTVYYSTKSGDWATVGAGGTWETDTVTHAVPSVQPTGSNPVVIRNGHTVTISNNTKSSGSLLIKSGGILDIGSTTGHNFGAMPDTKVTGTGTLKISSATFPSGDFGLFLSATGGTVEYYGGSFTIPVANTTYRNLIISPANGNVITLPNTNIEIYDSLKINGTGTGAVYFNTTATQTLTVDKNLVVNAGTLQFRNNVSQNLVVNNDIIIRNGATFNVENNATTRSHSVTSVGNITNNGTLQFFIGGSNVTANITFTGTSNKQISGTGATNSYNTITINKGLDRNSILDITSTNFSLNTALATALVLTNGTFRISSPTVSVTLSTSGTFSIPTTGCLSANGGTINIGNASNDAGDLLLAGRLEVISGTINVGPTSAPNNNNDIEYASAGYPEIEVSGGTLYVNGQIRRNTTNTLGSLNYNQSNGTVTIAGRNSVATRGKLEITNTGSDFSMSGGTLLLVNGGGTTYGDVLLTPETSSVTGGTITYGNTNTATTTFSMNSNVSIYNLTIDATTTTKTLTINVNPLTILNDITINGNSVLNLNGWDLTLGHDLTNNNTSNATGVTSGGFRTGSTTQTTTLNGTTTQTINGVTGNLTNFANLVNSSTSTVSVAANSNLYINSDLTLSSGTFNNGNSNVTVIGDVDNSATHSSGTGALIFAGTQKQTISGNGNGNFGNVTINNSSGVDMVDNSQINGTLTFTNGLLYIDDYKLTFGSAATITGASSTRMIITNGVLSDGGVAKIYQSGSSTFTYEIGVSGKYTPVTYNFSANSNPNLSVTVKPINTSHPGLSDAAGNELRYYWNVQPSTTTGFTVSHTYQYLLSDLSGTESGFVGGRYVTGSGWTPAAGGIVGGVISTINHTLTVSNTSYLDGEYTVGDASNFTPTKPTLYTRTSRPNNNWGSATSWTLNSDGSDCTTGCTSGYAYVPDGNPVVILTGNTITLNTNSAVAYSVDIQGTAILDIGTTTYHNLGHVRGNGTIKLTASTDGMYVFPGGYFDDFFNTSGTTLEFSGTNDATLPLKPGNNYKPYQNVVFSGSGTKYMSAENIKILGNLTINTGSGKLDNSLYNKNITILGNWTDNVNGGFTPGTGTVSFEGTSAQAITINGAESFYNLKINNASGVTLSSSATYTVSKYLYLTNGVLTTSSTNILNLTNTSTGAIIGGSSSSYVNGPLRKSILSGSSFSFPVGKSGRYGSVYLSSVTAAGTYEVEYYNSNPNTNIPALNPSSKVLPLDTVSTNEYWRFKGPAASAIVRLRWDASSGIIPATSAARAKLRVVSWNGSAWQRATNTANISGTQTSGTVQTTSAVVVGASDSYFTIGAESLPTVTITSSNISICNDGSSTANITVSLTGTSPWTIKYKVNGANETTISNIASSTYNIVLNSNSPGISGAGSYTYNISYVADNTGSSGIRDFTSSIILTVKPVPTPSITGRSTVGINETGVTYSTTNVGGNTYVWSVIGGSITAGQNTNQITVTWNGTINPLARVSVTETNGAPNNCSITSNLSITMVSAPTPVISGNSSVCQNATEGYSTPFITGHTYAWSVTGASSWSVVSGNPNQISVVWGNAASGTISVIESDGVVNGNANYSVTIHSLPLNNLTVSDPSICNGSSGTITVQSAEGATDYYLRNGTTVIQMYHTAIAGNFDFTISPISTVTYNVRAVNEYNCEAILTDQSIVTVNNPPTASAGTDDSHCGTAGYTISGANATNYASVSWTILSGSGSISNGTTLAPTYNPAAGDIGNTVTLQLTSIANAGCTNTNDSKDIIIYETPSTNTLIHD